MDTKCPTIWYVLNARWPTIRAYGVQVAKTVEALSKTDLRVLLIVPSRKMYPEQESQSWSELYKVDRSFEVIRLTSPDWVLKGWIGNIAFVLQQVIFAARATMFLRTKNGVIYSRDPVSLSVCSFLGMPLFWEVHKLPNRLGWVHGWLIRRLAGIVVLTQGLADRLIDEGMALNRILVSPDGVDLKMFSAVETQEKVRWDLGLPAQVPIIGYVGHLRTLDEEKGVGDLVRAFRKIIVDIPDAILLIVGGTERDIDSYKELCRNIGIGEGHVRFERHQPFSRVPAYLRSMSVAVMPFPYSEHYARFMSPMKMFEYMASGTPIVATDLPSVREVLDETTAFFVSPDQPAELARGIREAIQSSDTAARKARCAQREVAEYSWNRRAERIRDFIQINS